jgi:hypothetical protein
MPPSQSNESYKKYLLYNNVTPIGVPTNYTEGKRIVANLRESEL